MSGKILLIFAICIFSTMPSINTIGIKKQRSFNPRILTSSFWHFRHLYGNKRKTISGYDKENSMDMNEPLIRELKLEKTPVSSPGKITNSITQEHLNTFIFF